MTSTNAAAPVLIVGAGPTGLAAALDLARFGVPLRLIDCAPGPGTHSRAVAIQPRTLEMLQQRGCARRILELGHKQYAANFYSGEHRIAHLDFRPLVSPFPYVLFLDQTRTEGVLRERLQQLGVTVERGVELVAFEDRGDTVAATLKHTDNREEHMLTPYLLGCDGAHSFVRKHLGLEFEGRTYPQSFTLADLHVEWGRTDDEFHIFTSDEGLTAIFCLGNGRYRLVADFSGKPEHDEPCLDECQAILNRRLHDPPRVSNMSWSSYFHVNSRRVARLRAGRVFVAGDAAHIHSPAAGQGMNTGIQEAFNLAWKIALVLRGEADPGLLDTYDEERRPIERDVLSSTDFLINIVDARHGLARFFRDHIAPMFTESELVQSYARGFVTETDISYGSSPLTLSRSADGGVSAGERAPDSDIEVVSGIDGHGGTRRIFDLLSEPGFALLLLTNGNQVPPLLSSLAEGFSKSVRAPTHTWMITDARVPEGRGLADLYGRSRPAFCLVRPDGYIMARGGLDDFQAITAEISERWFQPGQTRGGSYARA